MKVFLPALAATICFGAAVGFGVAVYYNPSEYGFGIILIISNLMITIFSLLKVRDMEKFQY